MSDMFKQFAPYLPFEERDIQQAGKESTLCNSAYLVCDKGVNRVRLGFFRKNGHKHGVFRFTTTEIVMLRPNGEKLISIPVAGKEEGFKRLMRFLKENNKLKSTPQYQKVVYDILKRAIAIAKARETQKA